MSFKFTRLSIPDVMLVEPKVIGDQRGYFVEMYKFSEFKKAGIDAVFHQHNQSSSQKGVLRGLHYQSHPKAQAKLVHVIQGEIFDVAVDIRKKSPTYGRWVGEHLSAENKRTMYVPVGFAHGFCVLSDTAVISYFCSDEYAPETEGGIIWNDPDVGVKWPVSDPRVSARDAGLPNLRSAVNHF